jgi:tetratricopeptide (TPR) repeat protein
MALLKQLLSALLATTPGPIAIANLEHQIMLAEKRHNAELLVELSLMKSQFLGRHDALDRAEAIAANDPELRARMDRALHRAPPRDDIDGPRLAEEGRFEEADRAYGEALEKLNTTSPFPFAYLYFVRGVMWTERAGDAVRGRAMFEKALEHLPQYVAANVHVAELEKDPRAAVRRLESVIASEDPEALAALGALYVRLGDARGAALIARAKARFEALLTKYPLAFADHAAEFYLGPGADPERAWHWAKINADNRETERSLALAIRAARATGNDACAIVRRAKAKRRTGVELQALLTGC